MSRIANRVGLPVVDKTGAAGGYTFSLHIPPALAATTDESSTETGPSVFTTLEEQLGLRLVSQKVPRDVIVIDHLESPTMSISGRPEVQLRAAAQSIPLIDRPA